MPAALKTRAEWLKEARALPAQPGVYIMRDLEGQVIYVGKAQRLSTRVASYFQPGGSDYRAFIAQLSGLLGSLETVLAPSEKAALLLERELIRRHKPRFNVIWRDDKQFLCLKLDPSHPYPWVQVVRKMDKKDGCHYFGPYHSASAARQTLRVVNRHFQLRSCTDQELARRKRPCLEHQIGRCPAPCVKPVPQEDYAQNVEDVLMFLGGKGGALVDRLEQRMWAAAEREAYESAAHYRDQLRAVQKTLARQQIVLPTLLDQDAVWVHREGPAVAVTVVEMRTGRTQDVDSRFFEELSGEDSELIESLLVQRYALGEGADEGRPPPKELLLPEGVRLSAGLIELLSERRGARVKAYTPRRGDRRALLRLAEDNARHHLREAQANSGALDRTLDRLKRRLHLKNRPDWMECYDISNFQGTEVVGARVVFEGGRPAKRHYRRYKVKSVEGQDDFSSMYEVLSRRFQRAKDGSEPMPQLVVIDGGKGQLNVARAVFKQLGIEGVDLVGLAKARTQGADEDERMRRSEERVFRPGARDPIVLKQSSAELLLLARLRDEAHRFAISFHRARRDKRSRRTRLTELPGVGPARNRALLTHLGSLTRVRAASEAELAAVPGIGQRAAEQIYAALHPGEAKDKSMGG